MKQLIWFYEDQNRVTEPYKNSLKMYLFLSLVNNMLRNLINLKYLKRQSLFVGERLC